MTLDVERLLTELTLEEKAALTSGSSFWYTAPVERLGIPSIMVSDGPHGLRAQPGTGDHVGLGGSVPATCFPTASAIASSWDPGLLQRVGAALAQEARATNLSVILGPGVNMKRSPLCGRNFEYLSEDPYLAGELAVGIVDGIQSCGVGTSLKHYAANNQEEDRLRVDAQVDERTLREIYLPAFERVVTGAQPWTVMCSYNKVNGTSASENRWLLTTVLREEWGFEGLVVSDWGAVYHRVPATRAGLDLEMPPRLPRSPEEVAAAVRDGALDGDVLDDRVRAVLRLVSRGMHVLELDEAYDEEAHHALAREAAGDSVVLLENAGRLLPLSRGVRVGVVGEFARTPRFQGAGSSQVNPTRVDVALDEIGTVLDVVGFEPGYAVGPVAEGGSSDEELRSAAADLASRCDVVVVFLGLPPADESEGFDRTHMDLPASQLATLAAVAAANPNVVGVLVNGSTVLLDEVRPHTPALVEAWLGGQAAGGAIADVLCGATNPSGRLAESVPHRLEDTSSYLNFPGDSGIVRYGEGLYIGYRGYDKSRLDVAYPFGFGLSYTTFGYADADVTLSGSVEDGDLAARVEVTVTNQGSVDGAEVVQVYVRDVDSSVHRPVRELKGFAKAWLSAGSSQRVGIDLDQRAFSYWSDLLHRWVVEPGEFAIEVARHSRDIVETITVTVDGPSVAPPLRRESTLKEWLADPIGAEILRSVASADAGGLLADEDLVNVIGTMPMSTLAAFPGRGLDEDSLDALVAAYQERTGRREGTGTGPDEE
ncbi:Thermostable beta-glucosidase B [Nostocoides japonicum T1-X7]|uniref:Exo-alpha-(1->6)-L-arabinopyranosidase n=1 Tax=Nostocoides japonicum T1-X7 TaxID=1194083 RepID=A0A077LXJ5_9MICO|nr:glycoside hydrolase family 3 C-terminal domain-containing protein [Tetrasphaera japonica]CCH76694.1 Thermostable beta-glucosidase B [Tetrasphaera japonica T1-X7]